MEKVYLIEQIWVNPTKTLECNAVGYKSIGWVSKQIEAMKVCNKGKIYTSVDCWAILHPLPEFRWRELKSLKPS